MFMTHDVASYAPSKSEDVVECAGEREGHDDEVNSQPSEDEEAKEYLTNAFSSRTLHPMTETAIEWRNDITRSTRQWNIYSEILGTSIGPSRTLAAKALQTKRQLDMLLRDVECKVKQLEDDVNSFALRSRHDATQKWYRSVPDLTAHDLATLSNLLDARGKHVITVVDMSDFTMYLRETLTRAAQAQRPRGEDVHEFCSKLQVILEFITRSQCWTEALLMAIFMKTTIMRQSNSRVNSVALPPEHRRISQSIQRVLSVSDNACSPRAAGVTSVISFRNFALAWRQLWAGYLAWSDIERARYDIDNTFELLDDLHARASEEVRAKLGVVLAASQPKLPTELAELLFEHALIAEGIPLESPSF